MPCKWVTIKGRRVKLAGPVGASTATTQIGVLLPAMRLAALGLVYASHSPPVYREELKDAVIRIWHNEETGPFAEARFTPTSPPIYTALTPDQALSLGGPEPDPSLIAMVFDRKDQIDE